MSRIAERFAVLRERGERALVPFVTAGDPDLDPITFSIENKPDWASFEPTTGNLFGVPLRHPHQGLQRLVLADRLRPRLGNLDQYDDIGCEGRPARIDFVEPREVAAEERFGGQR